MNEGFHVTIDKADLNRVKNDVREIRNGSKTVMMRAINKTLGGVNTDSAKAVAADLNLTQSRIKKDVNIDKASTANLNGAFESKGKPVGLLQFRGTRPTKKGVSVQVKTSGKRSVIKHAFIARVSGVDHVFRREYSGARKPKRPGIKYGKFPEKYRLPVHRLEGPRVQDILGKKAVLDKIQDQADERMIKNLNDQIDFMLSKLE